MDSSRLRVPSVLLAAGLVLAGCGGGGHRTATRTAGPTSAAASPTQSPPPSLAPDRVASALLPAGRIAPRIRRETPATPALKKHAVPSCSLASITPSGHPEVAVREYSTTRYTGANFGQIALTYPDAAAAGAMFATIRAKTSACPARHHVPQKHLSAKQIALAHDDTWHVSQDVTRGWSHVRGLEKAVYPPSASIINVIYTAYDYVSRGNVVIASMYWERVKPAASPDAVAKKATVLLDAQLARLG